MRSPIGVGTRSPIKPFTFYTPPISYARVPAVNILSLSASMSTFDGALAKQTGKALLASMSTFAGTLTKQTSKVLSAAMSTFAGALTKQTLRALLASMSTFAGTLVKQTGKSLSASMSTFAGSLTKQTLKAIVASMSTFAGTLVKKTLKSLSASMSTFSGLLTKQTLKALLASMSTFAGSLTKQTLKTLAASTSTFAGTLVKKTNKALTAGMSTFSGLLTASHVFLLSLNASMSTFSGSLSRQTGKSLLASMSTFSGSTTKFTKKFLSASMSTFSGNLNKFTTKFFNAAMSLWQAILNAVKPSSAPVVLPTGVLIARFGAASISMSVAGTQTFTQATPTHVIRADNWSQLGQRLMGGQLLVAPSSGGLSNHVWTVVAQGVITIPSSASGAGVALNLFENYFSPVKSDALGSASQSLAPGQFNWSIVSKLSGNGKRSGVLRADYTVTINGVPTTGVAFSNVNQFAEPQLQLSIAATFSGTIAPTDFFQATMTQFDLIQPQTNS